MKRHVLVDNVYIINISNSSACICGESGHIDAYTRALAIQRQVPVFFEDEGNYEDYPIFSRSIPAWQLPSEVDLDVRHDHKTIQVGCLDVIATASASVVQVGSNDTMDLESRVKAIRHFITDASQELKDYTGIIVRKSPLSYGKKQEELS
ncbi:spore germination protein GerPE [Paenibacillus lautus]|uniref:Spore germination protein GerPE n=1 Tax=Paenibacillus lautus TaxID=1401 RepID=A0A385TQW3_PAELA|nr:spore germination protein GerPE [Paenibacillus lautus]AYB44942.1 spore germination protein GerPE [Paenibacillus lautus]